MTDGTSLAYEHCWHVFARSSTISPVRGKQALCYTPKDEFGEFCPKYPTLVWHTTETGTPIAGKTIFLQVHFSVAMGFHSHYYRCMVTCYCIPQLGTVTR